MVDIKSLSSNQRFAMNVLVPSLYLFPLVFAYIGPKNFGFGYDGLVYTGLAVGVVGMTPVSYTHLTLPTICSV